jgi:hypothetical protein
MSTPSLERFSLASRARGFLGSQGGVALCAGLLAVLPLAYLLLAFYPARELDTRGWQLSDFLDYLQRRGVQFHVVPGTRYGSLERDAYLTEDADATWACIQHKLKVTERIDQWSGTVWVGRVDPRGDVEQLLAYWGPYGCRIGNFLLFGDERLLRQIQEVCR